MGVQEPVVRFRDEKSDKDIAVGNQAICPRNRPRSFWFYPTQIFTESVLLARLLLSRALLLTYLVQASWPI